MKTFVKVFTGSGAFLIASATIYWFVTDREWAGRVLLLGTGIATLIMASYAWAKTRGSAVETPEDRPDADPAEGVNEPIASFTMASPWPIVFGVGVAVLGAGLVFGVPLLIVGVLLIAVAVIGMMRESIA